MMHPCYVSVEDKKLEVFLEVEASGYTAINVFVPGSILCFREGALKEY